jgi:Coenzyme PQQ synthesis protein D (PqqD)
MKISKNIAISDAGLVFNPVTGESFSANPIGVEIINLIREGKSNKAISESILTRYTTEAATFEKDLHDFTDVLRHFNLLEEHEEKKA